MISKETLLQGIDTYGVCAVNISEIEIIFPRPNLAPLWLLEEIEMGAILGHDVKEKLKYLHDNYPEIPEQEEQIKEFAKKNNLNYTFDHLSYRHLFGKR